MWLSAARKAGLVFYVSDKTIGRISFETSTWYTGRDEKFFYAKGAYCKNVHSRTFPVWAMYYALRAGRKNCDIPMKDRLKWIYNGARGYKKTMSYAQYSRWLAGNETEE